MMILKVTRKESFTLSSGSFFLNRFLGLRCVCICVYVFFLNETLNISFCQISNFSFYLKLVSAIFYEIVIFSPNDSP